MAKSLSKIMGQIEKLQKEAAAIQSTVITRIKREIAQHGLTVEHLFGSSDSTVVASGTKSTARAEKTRTVRTSAAQKPAKYSDGQGNSWHGVGKRPAWIHAALDAGRSLDEFLAGAKKAGPAAKKANIAVKVAPQKAKKVAAKKKAAPAKKAVKPTKAAAVAERTAKAPAKRGTRAAPVKKASLKKSVKASPAEAVQTGEASA